jgi:saccharopine dehydrogenase-like NADP-dependent oxidoreductase
MNILLLGVGLQGRAALYDLVRSEEVERVFAADADQAGLAAYVEQLGSDKVTPLALDAGDPEQLAAAMAGADAVIELLPPAFHALTARAAVEAGVHWVNASYPTPEMEALDEQAKAAGVALLPECGLDPGIDLLLAAQALRELDQVHEFYSYGSGIPEPAAADNPVAYKISWTFDGVLRGYRRPGRLVTGGKVTPFSDREQFEPRNVHRMDVAGLGGLEAYPNGDVVPYLEALGILGSVQEAARYTARWPGHAAFWKKLVDLGFLDDEPIEVEGAQVSPLAFVRELLAPQLQYADDERDVAFLRVEASGLKDGEPRRVVYEVVDYRDLESGLLAMQRTVGFTASIATQMLVRGDIDATGLLSPLTDVPADLILEELEARGVHVRRSVQGV